MKVIITKEQRKHLKSLRWLFSGPRGSGRTTLLAYVLIETVLKTGQEMRIIDHHSNHRADIVLSQIIGGIIKEEGLPLEISRSSLTLKRIK